jgi:hypothetical protein
MVEKAITTLDVLVEAQRQFNGNATRRECP